jgi:hypothetical protein
MTAILIAISAAYVVLGVLVLAVGLGSRYVWWLKAGGIVIASAFFIEIFFASQGLLGWPGSGRLPPKFQLLWSRVVEPDQKIGSHGAIYLWVEEVDSNNVPSGVPRSYRLPYSLKLADRANKARDEIMSGNPQEGVADDLAGNDDENNNNTGSAQAQQSANLQNDGGTTSASAGNVDLTGIMEQIPHVEFRAMTGPVLPAKP